ncbi:MAG: hypothetical protein JWO02_203 [Solirubrobacterales bacterium]|nr:hypothetical protein [Solirubrobacterales bacterium]
MPRRRRLSLALLCALPLALAGAPAAHADAFTDVFKAYSKTGTIDPCKFTPAQLKQAKGQIPNDYAQYAPDFKDAIDAAAKARAAGACKDKTSGTTTSPSGPAAGPASGSSSSGTGTPAAGTTSTPAPSTTPATPAATPTTATATPQPAPSVSPAPAVADGAILTAATNTQDNGSGLPAPLVALAFVALLAALVAAVLGAARWWAVDPQWMQRSRHATSEAGWRTSAAWAEFTDWLRLGR